MSKETFLGLIRKRHWLCINLIHHPHPFKIIDELSLRTCNINDFYTMEEVPASNIVFEGKHIFCFQFHYLRFRREYKL